ncbi:MAG: glycosyltransferase [Tissierellia bacterium]|nr:glycosyltransferase [Tissierellia bacterium]
MTKYMIFHVPNHLDPQRMSGSHIRPFRMKEAFEAIGYEVDMISGYKDERKRAMEKIQEKINRGIHYEFCYSESSTMPTELTESHHLPTTFGLDFGFFKRLKKRGIPIGLFYRDCYWLFDEYKEATSFLKGQLAIRFYKRDLKKYKELVDILYLPHESMAKHLPISYDKVSSLPPGIDELEEGKTTPIPPLELFYVGGMTGHYNLEMIFSIVSQMDKVHLTVCTRASEWSKVKERYKKYLAKNIEIIHGDKTVYRPYLERADLGIIFTEPTEYWDFAVPVKLFEYLRYGIPVLGNPFTATEKIIEKAGFIVDYDEKSLKDQLERILKSPNILEAKKKSVMEFRKEHLWTKRAEKVERELKNIR